MLTRAAPHAQVETSIYVSPSGERILRTTTTTFGPDGRATRRVEERSLGQAGEAQRPGYTRRDAYEPAQPAVGGLRDALKALAAPFIAAAMSTVVRSLSRALRAAAAAFLRALVRRILGGR
jgi:hypothetical protein